MSMDKEEANKEEEWHKMTIDCINASAIIWLEEENATPQPAPPSGSALDLTLLHEEMLEALQALWMIFGVDFGQ